MPVRFAANTAYVRYLTSTPPDTACTYMAWGLEMVDTNTFEDLITVHGASDDFTLQTTTDGTSWKFYSAGVSQNFTRQPLIRTPFCAAITSDGTTMSGYLRRARDTRFEVLTNTYTGFAPAGFAIGQYDPNPFEGFRGATYNVKVWSRCLSHDQLMAESHSDELVDPRDCFCFWKLKHPGDLNDYGPTGQKRPERVGTLQPFARSAFPTKILPRKLTRAHAPSAGGFFSRCYYDMIGRANSV